MKNLTIRRRIMASFAVVVALMVIMATLAYTRFVNVQSQATWIAADALPGLTYANQIVVERIANYSLTQEFVLHDDMASKQKLSAAILASRAYMDTLATEYVSTIHEPSDQTQFDAYASAVE